MPWLVFIAIKDCGMMNIFVAYDMLIYLWSIEYFTLLEKLVLPTVNLVT